MIEVKDRIPTYPGRVKLIPVPGQENTYDMIRADDPIEPGTPINKALFDSYAAQIDAAVRSMNAKVFELSQRVQLGTLSDGAVFGLYESGVLVPYVKVQNFFRTAAGYTEIQRAVVLRLDCVATMKYRDAVKDPLYAGSIIDSWLQNEFINTLDGATQSVLAENNVQISNESNGTNNISRKVFILSSREYNFGEPAGFPTVGINMLYFSDDGRRVSGYNGTPISYYTRSISGTLDKVAVINPDGSLSTVDATTEAGVRPAFTLPLTFEVTAGMPSTANVVATAEVI